MYTAEGRAVGEPVGDIVGIALGLCVAFRIFLNLRSHDSMLARCGVGAGVHCTEMSSSPTSRPAATAATGATAAIGAKGRVILKCLTVRVLSCNSSCFSCRAAFSFTDSGLFSAISASVSLSWRSRPTEAAGAEQGMVLQTPSCRTAHPFEPQFTFAYRCLMPPPQLSVHGSHSPHTCASHSDGHQFSMHAFASFSGGQFFPA